MSQLSSLQSSSPSVVPVDSVPVDSAPVSTSPHGNGQNTSRWALLLGGLMSGGFYALVHLGHLQGEFVQTYFASHPVEYVAMTLFCIGMAALFLKLLDISAQSSSLEAVTLPTIPGRKWSAEDCRDLLHHLSLLPAKARRGYLGCRLHDAITYVRRQGNAESLDETLRHGVDLDADRSYESYALVRIVIWAIPILGFLGTVIGITLAVANLAPEQLEQSLPVVISALSVAFNTTALSLGLSIVLMFAQFFTSRSEATLLAEVDARTGDLLVGRFEQYGLGDDQTTAAVRRLAGEVTRATEHLVERQAQIWQSTIDAAHQRWSDLSEATGAQLRDALGSVLAGSLDRHAAVMTAQQDKLVEQGNILLKVVDATGRLATLEEGLNRNLKSVAEAGNFSETAISLSAAVNLLAARLGSPDAQRVQLAESPTRATGNAA